LEGSGYEFPETSSSLHGVNRPRSACPLLLGKHFLKRKQNFQRNRRCEGKKFDDVFQAHRSREGGANIGKKRGNPRWRKRCRINRWGPSESQLSMAGNILRGNAQSDLGKGNQTERKRKTHDWGGGEKKGVGVDTQKMGSGVLGRTLIFAFIKTACAKERASKRGGKILWGKKENVVEILGWGNPPKHTQRWIGTLQLSVKS